MIGFKADYFFSDCFLPSSETFKTNATLIEAVKQSRLNSSIAIELIFIGDSNIMRHMKPFFDGVTNRYIDTRGGLMEMMEDIKEDIDDLPDDRYYFVMFNSGLHDLHTLCPATPEQRKDRIQYLNASNDEDFNCHDAYRVLLEQFTRLVMDIPSVLTVFETTTAAWPKWGLYSAAWRPAAPQIFPRFPQASYEFNRVALDTLRSFKDVYVMDGYWLTYARPDHREVTPPNTLSDKLVHAGPEVYSVLTRQFAAMILDAIDRYAPNAVVEESGMEAPGI